MRCVFGWGQKGIGGTISEARLPLTWSRRPPRCAPSLWTAGCENGRCRATAAAVTQWNNQSNPAATARDQWPESDLEYLGRCPACGGEPRTVRFDGLEDKAFRAAAGRWMLHDCATCGAAYLDPRPSPSSIGSAYAGYYTHSDFSADESRYFWRQADLKARLKIDYLNKTFGYNFPNALPGGNMLLRLRPRARLALEFSIRHLPAPRRPGSKLLDVGCGNGQFLVTARALGYQPIGIEPDPNAVAAGRQNGLDIRPGLLPNPELAAGEFEHVTLNHVFEHLPWPREALDQIFELLAPKGRLWMSQPNLLALGLQKFGPNWRGLETPRHLSLYGYETLSRLLSGAGFVDICLLPAEEAAEFYYRQSALMSRDQDPYAPDEVEPEVLEAAAAANREARRSPERAESITVTARRP